MYYYEVAPNRIVRAGQETLTYCYHEKLAVGQLVRIPIGSSQATGVVISETKKPDYPVKEMAQLLPDLVLPQPILQLSQWLSTYYATPLATVLQTVLPRGVEKQRRTKIVSPPSTMRKRTNFVFTNEQKLAIASVNSATQGTCILHGVTGSGKTAVYIELAKHAISQGNSVIILVPEIALTSQLVDEFSHHFSEIILTHSGQTEAERHTAWMKAYSSKVPCVVVGPRSAIFMPLQSVGLIVIDEAHEPSYKQEQSPRYQTARAAHVLATAHGAKLVLGSATPSVQDYYLAKETTRPIIEMNRPAQPSAQKPALTTIDMTTRSAFKRHRFLSDTLLAQLEDDFANGKQAMIFHNRRGSTAVTLCENCGWQAGCPRCYIPLTLHADIHQLQCHICGLKDTVPTSCPECSHASIIHKGIGTKLIESELTKLFPKIRIARFDGDSKNDSTVEACYQQLYDGTIQLIIGTQVIAKGLDLPRLHTVGIVQADAGLSLPDFSASERTFQLLAQAVGRVGRSDHATNVIVQSYQPTHPIIQFGLVQDYAGFYRRILGERKRGYFPPYCYLLKLVCTYKTEASCIKNTKKMAEMLHNTLPSDVEILGPTPAFYERSRDTYRWQLVLKSPKREHLLAALSHLPSPHWQFELDPISLL
ncbi:primosomal protein N' [Candidatus Saccharibacteria bacterium]|nr:primosomal protein N' [Candidatus Saccharibacteria bacterium]